MTEALSLASSVLAGLGGAAHCAAMCGPLAGAVGDRFRQDHATPLGPALLFNSGRVIGYVGMGSALAGLTGWLLSSEPERLAAAFRIGAAMLLILLGLQIARGRSGFGAERLGARLWTRLRPVFGYAVALPAAVRPMALGLLWGFMPCGLVYTMFVTAASRADRLEGALLMAAFGLGTLPAVVGFTLGGATLGRWLGRRWPRHVAAAALTGCGIWTLVVALQHFAGHSGHHPASHVHSHHVAYRRANAYTGSEVVWSANGGHIR
jgi:uncharacterized protein